MRRLFPTLLLIAGACSASIAPPDKASFTHTTTNGVLRFTTTDFLSQGGILWARPTPVASPLKISFQSTRYGSLCRYDVEAQADTAGQSIVVHVRFTQLLTMCTAEIRALRYQAELTVLPATYDLTVVHEEGAQTDTVIHQKVVVPEAPL